MKLGKPVIQESENESYLNKRNPIRQTAAIFLNYSIVIVPVTIQDVVRIFCTATAICMYRDTAGRVVSSEIFRKLSAENFLKFIPIFPEICGNFLKCLFLCESAISKSSDAVK